MKLSRMIAAAGLVVASLGVSAAADAQMQDVRAPARVVTTRTVRTTTVTHHRSRWHAPRCTTKWRHHRKVRVCR
jgi:hypothetical protein